MHAPATSGKTPGHDGTAGNGPLVSVIMVSYNTREMTLAAIRSLYETASDVDFELFVYDNASSDGSADAIAAAFPTDNYPRLTLVRLQENVGFAKANNMAAKRAHGRYLLLLNPDTVVLPGAVQKLLSFAHRRPEARIWGARNLLGDGTLDQGSCWGKMSLWSVFSFATGLESLIPNSPLFRPEGYGGWDRSTEREVVVITGCFFLVDADLWHELGGFDERFFMYAEEADFCLRARKLGAAPRFTPEAEIIHYGGASENIRARQIAKIFAGKISLAKKHWPAWKVALVRLLYRLAVLVRWLGYSLAGRILRRAGWRESGAIWGEAWKMRKDWLEGY